MSASRPERPRGPAAFAGLALAALGCAPGGTSRAPELPDVLVVVADDLSWPELEACETPALDRLAAAGLRFEGLYAAAPSCSPFRGSLLFGLRPDRVGIGRPVLPVRSWGKHAGLAPEDNPPFPDDLYSLADLAREAGYRTAAFGKCHLTNARSADPDDYMRAVGFEHWGAGTVYGLTGYGGPGGVPWLRVDDGRLTRETLYNPEAIDRDALEWWRTTEGPRFAYVAHNLPHEPFHHPSGEGPDDDGARFAAMVSELDRRVDELLDGVGFWSDPASVLVVFVSDNGTPPKVVRGERKRRVKASVYEDGVRVPALFAGWRVAGGGRATPSSVLASSTDFVATFAELWGTPLPAGAAPDSRSFLAVLLDPAVERARELVFAQHWEPNGEARPEKDPCRYMVRRADGRKLVREGRVADAEGGRWELYDLASDPEERSPLDPAAARADLEELRRALVERARW